MLCYISSCRSTWNNWTEATSVHVGPHGTTGEKLHQFVSVHIEQLDRILKHLTMSTLFF